MIKDMAKIKTTDQLLLIPIGSTLQLVSYRNAVAPTAFEDATVQNIAKEAFLCEINVFESEAFCDGDDTQRDGLGITMQRACAVDIEEIAKRLFESALVNCDRSVKVAAELMREVTEHLREAITCPLDVLGGQLEPIIFRLVPAIAVDRGTGALVAYALGQLVSCSVNDPRKRIFFKGYARDEETQKILVNSVVQSQLTSHNIEK